MFHRTQQAEAVSLDEPVNRTDCWVESHLVPSVLINGSETQSCGSSREAEPDVVPESEGPTTSLLPCESLDIPET